MFFKKKNKGLHIKMRWNYLQFEITQQYKQAYGSRNSGHDLLLSRFEFQISLWLWYDCLDYRRVPLSQDD